MDVPPLDPDEERPPGVAYDGEARERAGDEEPCDWCGRPGRVEQLAWWGQGDILEGRNPALCAVCSFWFNIPFDVVDAMDEAGCDYDNTMKAFEDELKRKWRAKVEQGTRDAQQPNEIPRGSMIILTKGWTPKVESPQGTDLPIVGGSRIAEWDKGWTPGTDHTTLLGLFASPQRWTEADRQAVEFVLAEQRQLLEACHPNDHRGRETLVSIVEQIEAALATGSA